MHFSIRFYEDVVRYHETSPVRLHSRVYPTVEEAEKVAKVDLAGLAAKHGEKTGYVIFDSNGIAVAIGPGRG